MRWPRIAAVLLVLVAAWWLFGRSHGPSTAEAPIRPPVLVRVARAEARSVPYVVRAPGLVMASETVAVTSRVDSQVMEVHFREGDMVHAGQLLFTLDDRALMADLRRQEAALATTEAERNNAERQFERARKLAAGGFESTAVLDKSRADFESSQANSAATTAEIERLRVMLDYTKITAAIDGRAGAITATVGNTVQANDQPLVVINRISPIRVQLGLPQQALAPLRELMSRGDVPVRVVRDGVELPDTGRIEFVDNNINRTTGTFECRAQFDNKEEALWPGMIVEALVRLGEDSGVLVVPEIAVQHAASGSFVFVIEKDTARRRPVKVRRYGEGLALIDTGLTEGDVVATDGMLSLSEGSPVEVPAAKASSPGSQAPSPDQKAPSPDQKPAASAGSSPK